MPRPPLPVTPEQFAALVAELRAELAAASEARKAGIRSHMEPGGSLAPPPGAFAGRVWTAVTADLHEAATLTGYTWYTLHVYAAPASARHWPHARFPQACIPAREGTGRRWRIGTLAIWAADRDPAVTRPVPVTFPRRLPSGKPPAPKDRSAIPWYRSSTRQTARRRRAATEFATALVRQDPALTLPALKTAAAQAGIQVTRGWPQILDQARAAALPHILARFAPRADGTVPLTQVAAVFRVSAHTVRVAAGRGEIRAVRDGWPYVTDPSRLRYRKANGRATMLPPVDRDHPLAVPLPGDRPEQKEAS